MEITSTSPEYGQVRSPIHKSEVILDLIRNKDLVEILESLFVGLDIPSGEWTSNTARIRS